VDALLQPGGLGHRQLRPAQDLGVVARLDAPQLDDDVLAGPATALYGPLLAPQPEPAPAAEPLREVGQRLHLDLAPHTMGRHDDADDDGTLSVNVSLSQCGRGVVTPGLVP